MSNESLPDRPRENLEIIEEKEVRRCGSCRVEREKIRLEDGEEAWVTTIHASPETSTSLLLDEDLIEKGMVTEPTGLLIDQKATEEMLGRKPGKRPEEFLQGYQPGQDLLAVCPTNAGWQKGAFWVKDGQLVSLPNDDRLSGSFDIIGLTDDGWVQTSLTLQKGQVKDLETLQNLKLGFSLPTILKDGGIVPLGQIIADPRLEADYRNAFDFGAGKKLPGEFWRLLRKVMPAIIPDGIKLEWGEPVVVSRDQAMKPEELKEFEEIIEKAGLEEYFRVDTQFGRIQRFLIKKKLPLQRLPTVGIGFNQGGDLLITTVDGRQEGSAGASIEELAEIMKLKGALTVGFGSAGGDVAVVLRKAEGGFELLNSPSTIDKETGKRITRSNPSLLVLG